MEIKADPDVCCFDRLDQTLLLTMVGKRTDNEVLLAGQSIHRLCVKAKCHGVQLPVNAAWMSLAEVLDAWPLSI